MLHRRKTQVAIWLSLLMWFALVSAHASAQLKMVPATVRVLSKGQRPHQKLRYRLRPGQKYQMNITMHMNMRMTIQQGDQAPIPRKVSIPPMELVNQLQCMSVSKQGAADIRVRLVNARPIKTPNVNPMMMASLQKELQRMRGLSMRLTFSSQGMLIKSRVENTPTISPQFQQLLTNIQNTFRQIATPLPQEAVGQGARWSVINQLRKPLRLTQITTFTLKKKQGSILRLGVQIKQHAKDQLREVKARVGNKVRQIKLKMSITSKGQGNNTFRLNRLWIRSGLQMVSDMRVLNMGKQPQRVRTLMNIKTYVRSSPVKK